MAYRKIGTGWDPQMRTDIDTMFKELYDKYTGAGLDAAEAREKAIQAVTDAAIAKDVAETTREEMLAIIREQTQNGDLAPEIAQARQGKATLGDNLNSIKSDLAQNMKQSFADKNRAELYAKLVNLNNTGGIVTMVGDSLTGGVSSGGHPYFEPWIELFPNITFVNKGIGGNTSKMVLARVEDIAKTNADLYIIAVGANDIRYRDSNSAITAEEFVSVIEDIISALSQSDFVCLNPWPAFDEDTSSKLSYIDRDNLTDDFTAALANYCFSKQIPFIETNNKLRSVIDWKNKNKVLVDSIHPRYPEGINLYADTVLYGNNKGYDYGLDKTKAIGKYLYRIEILSVSNLQTQFNNIYLSQLISDKRILEIHTDNFRNGYSDPYTLLDEYDANKIFSNNVGQFPLNITFSTDEPITTLYQNENQQNRLIGKYNIYYSNNKAAIVDLNHPSWHLKYSNMDLDEKMNNLIYAEPISNQEQRYFYKVTIVPKGSAVFLKKLTTDKPIIGSNSYGFSSVDPFNAHIIAGHSKFTRTGSSSSGYVFFSSSKKIRNLKLGFEVHNSRYDVSLATSDEIDEFNSNPNDARWTEIYNATDQVDNVELNTTIPAH